MSYEPRRQHEFECPNKRVGYCHASTRRQRAGLGGFRLTAHRSPLTAAALRTRLEVVRPGAGAEPGDAGTDRRDHRAGRGERGRQIHADAAGHRADAADPRPRDRPRDRRLGLAARRLVGYCPDVDAFYEDMSGREFVRHDGPAVRLRPPRGAAADRGGAASASA